MTSNALTEWKNYWFLPVAAALGYATATMYVYSIGPFIGPIQEEFGWSRAKITSGITIAAFFSAFFGIPMGMLIDRIGPRKIGLTGIVLMCAAFGLLGTATGGEFNWIALWALLAVATVFLHATVWTSAVTSRFQASRGLALAITLSGASVSAALFPIISSWLIENYSWRVGFHGLAALWVVIVFPIAFLFFRGAQDQNKANKETADNSEHSTLLTGLSLNEGLRSPAFYKLILAALFFTFTALGIVVHFVPILMDSGADRMGAAGIASLIGIFSIVGRLGTGFLLDRFPAHVIGGMAFLIPIIGCSLLLLDGSNATYQSIAAAIFGLTLGSEVDVIAFLAARYFGLKNFGALYGAMVMALSFGTALGPMGAGMVYDNYGSYSPFLVLTAILMGASAVALFSLASTPTSEEFVARRDKAQVIV